MTISRKPYELLVRWDDAGVLKGASIKWREAALDDSGVEVFSRISDPEAIAVAGQKGYPLVDILKQLHTDALIAVDCHVELLAEKDKEIAELQSQLSELITKAEGA